MAIDGDRRNDAMKETLDRLEKGVKDVFSSDNYAEYLKVMSRFYNYSPRNSMLIYLQNPQASLVAGYQAWQSNFGRYVKKGEKGISIIAPTQYKKKIETQKIDPATKNKVLDAGGNPVTELKEETFTGFRVARVFDVSQTDGKPLPSFAFDLQNSVPNYDILFESLKRAAPCPVSLETIPDNNPHGYYSRTENRIVISDNMSQAQTLETAIHELAHALLHNRKAFELAEERGDSNPDRNTREVEAESIAYTVCQHFGIDTSDYSFGYIAGWSANKELKELQDSLDIIQKTSAEIITGITDRSREVEAEFGIRKHDDPEELADHISSLVERAGTADVNKAFGVASLNMVINDLQSLNQELALPPPDILKGSSVEMLTDEAAAREAADKLNRAGARTERQNPDATESAKPERPATAKPEPENSKPKRKYYITARQREQAERMAEKWEARAEAFYAGGEGWGYDTDGYCKTVEEAEQAEQFAEKIRTAIENFSGGNGVWADVQTVLDAVSSRDGLDAEVTANQDLLSDESTSKYEYIVDVHDYDATNNIRVGGFDNFSDAEAFFILLKNFMFQEKEGFINLEPERILRIDNSSALGDEIVVTHDSMPIMLKENHAAIIERALENPKIIEKIEACKAPIQDQAPIEIHAQYSKQQHPEFVSKIETISNMEDVSKKALDILNNDCDGRPEFIAAATAYHKAVIEYTTKYREALNNTDNTIFPIPPLASNYIKPDMADNFKIYDLLSHDHIANLSIHDKLNSATDISQNSENITPQNNRKLSL